jgi:FkbM family methyltransferase
MNILMNKILARLRISLFPTEHDKEVNRWLSDGGDDRFRYDYNLCSDSLVLDLGGYKGQWASDIYARYNCRIMVFEPVKTFADKIIKRFSSNPRIEVHVLALGNSRRSEQISLGDDASSLFRDTPKKETIQFEDIAVFFAEQNIQTVNLMKVNIEGGEYELLPRLIETGLINRIENLQIQFHRVTRESESQMEKICSELEKTHRPTYRYKFMWENWALR